MSLYGITGGPFRIASVDQPSTTVYGLPPGAFVRAPYVQFGALVRALEFDGVNDRAEATVTLGAFTGFSIAGWIVPTALGGNRCIFATNSVFATNQFLLRAEGNNLGAYSFNSGTTVIAAAGALPTPSIPYHIAFTISASYDATTYVNGVRVGGPVNIPVANRPSGISLFRFGAEGAGSNLFQGRMSTFNIFGRELSAAEVNSAYVQRSIFASSPDNVLAYYPMDQLAPLSTQTPDISGNARHLNLVNMVANPIVNF